MLMVIDILSKSVLLNVCHNNVSQTPMLKGKVHLKTRSKKGHTLWLQFYRLFEVHFLLLPSCLWSSVKRFGTNTSILLIKLLNKTNVYWDHKKRAKRKKSFKIQNGDWRVNWAFWTQVCLNTLKNKHLVRGIMS